MLKVYEFLFMLM